VATGFPSENAASRSPALATSAVTYVQAGGFRSARTRTMTLNFPNQCRYYDATRRAVQFWGHDSAMEAAFFVTEEALKRVQPNVQLDEAGLLRAFDLNRDTIYAVAAKIYKRGRRSFDLVSTDF